MSMQIKNELNRLFFMNFSDKSFDSLNLRDFLSPLSIPASIEIKAICIASIISENNTVNIHHRNAIDIKFP